QQQRGVADRANGPVCGVLVVPARHGLPPFLSLEQAWTPWGRAEYSVFRGGAQPSTCSKDQLALRPLVQPYLCSACYAVATASYLEISAVRHQPVPRFDPMAQTAL